MWKVAGASVTGFSHHADGTVCQDAHAISTTKSGWLVGVLCDGAGSARCSDASAKLFSSEVVAQLLHRLDAVNGGEIQQRVVQNWVEEFVQGVRNQLQSSKLQPAETLQDFHATLLGVVAGPSWGMFFHVGDGAGCAATSNDLAKVIMSGPENGEYANETYFVTQDDWREHFRVTSFDSQYDLIALMSDGVTPFALAKGQLGLFPPFFEPLSRYLAEHTREEGERAIADILERDAIRSITGDDKTLIWAFRDCSAT